MVQHRIFITESIDCAVNSCVALSLLVQNLTDLIIGDVASEIVSGYFLVTPGQEGVLLLLESVFRLLKGHRQKFELGSLNVFLIVIVSVLLFVDVVRDIRNLSSPLLYRRVKLHRVLGGVLQGLLQVGDLSGELSLRCYE